MNRSVLKLSSITFLAGGIMLVPAGLAQMGGAQMGGAGSMGGQTNGSQMGMPNGGINSGMNRPGMQPGTPGMSQNALQANSERIFLVNALNDNSAERDLSKLALKKSTNEDLKKLAQQVITDNRNIERSLGNAAMASSTLAVGQTPDQARKAEKKMKEMTGVQFDGNYLSQMLAYVKNDQKVSLDASSSLTSTSGVGPIIMQVRSLADNRIHEITQLAASENIKIQ